jgi:hypothetical protein
MSVTETLQPEAGDDRNSQIEIDKLHEIWALPPHIPQQMGRSALMERVEYLPSDYFIG